MLLHVRPRLFSWYEVIVELIDIQVEPFGLNLRGGVDLITGRFARNRLWWSACRKNTRRKVYDGILIEAPDPVAEFSFVARWAIAASDVVTHRVSYRLLDHAFDAASDNTEFWCGFLGLAEEWPSRWPAEVEPDAAQRTEPLMELVDRPDRTPAEDRFDAKGCLIPKAICCDSQWIPLAALM